MLMILFASLTLMEYLPSLSVTTTLLVPFSETLTPAKGSPLSPVICPLTPRSGRSVLFSLLRILCPVPEGESLYFAHRSVDKLLCSKIRQSAHLALYQTPCNR